ncbi:phage portal protein [Nocardia terpenica]|uniref:phage portal protein n=1 Tax=Nocardia terpenica TaxID=455432 RepID=UPI0018959072|nr:phage portal protein [Nocardia terpenica]MBF6060517.1 phage portal protein [Nocardia terpenica]MBF6103777.1 phage portal protein [Nocardia terpenica]MBF6111849.1 phage portal protein [Nocardia terpenica]MBF6117998.1 phage portal protein [Nocardia terpenica]MBF6155276.1 phage portal protein [Nocardia terpenica]
MLLRDGSVSMPASALAEFSPQIYKSYWYPWADGIQLERQWALYGAIYRYQPWVRTVVDKLANALARLRIEVWKVDGGLRTLDDGPYATLMKSPCQELSPYSFWLWVATTIEIYGEAFLVKVRDTTGATISLIPMHPSRVAVRRNADGSRSYIFQTAASSQGLLEFGEAEVVPLQLYSPDGTMRGLSRLESLTSTLVAEDSGRTATSSMWRNAGRPNIVLSSDKVLGREGKARLRESFDSNHAGSANAGKTLVLEDGVKAAPIQLTAVEMQWIESRKLNREEVCALFDVAPPMVHILDKATFSNITEQMRSFYRDSMSAKLEFVESQLDFYLGAEFGDDLEARYAVAEVLRGDYESRADSVQKLVLSGVMKPAEGREVMDLGKAGPEADELYAQASIQPLGKPAERVTITGTMAPGGDPDGIPVLIPGTAGGLSPRAQAALGGPDDSTTNPPPPPSSKYVRALKGGMGRGRSLEDVAVELARRHAADRRLILDSVALILADP